jgi:glycosyltransferase involved in cell wall biosynthesis
VDGFYTDEKDTTQITKKISLLIQNQNVAQEMGEKAFAKVKEKYSWKKHAYNLLSAISEPS